MLVSDVVEQARKVLQDTDATSGYRYSDSDFEMYVGDAVRLARSLRPDIFIGNYAAPIPTRYALTDVFPLPDQYAEPTTYYISGRAELRDDEYAVDGRAVSFIGKLQTALLKGV